MQSREYPHLKRRLHSLWVTQQRAHSIANPEFVFGVDGLISDPSRGPAAVSKEVLFKFGIDPIRTTFPKKKKRTLSTPKENRLENFSGLKELSGTVVDTKTL